MCTAFKNHAMTLLYIQQPATSFAGVVTTANVRHAYDNSGPTSKLRSFYRDFVATYFQGQDIVQGIVEQWDKLLLECADLRLLPLRGIRVSPSERDFGKKEHYLDDDVPRSRNEGEAGCRQMCARYSVLYNALVESIPKTVDDELSVKNAILQDIRRNL